MLLVYFLFFLEPSLNVHIAESLIPNGDNVCSRTVYYSESYTVVETYTETVYYTTCCSHFIWCWDSCTRSRQVQRTRQAVRYRVRVRTVYECCDGYRQQGGSCVAICEYGCVNGECKSPNNCVCYSGFQGVSCNTDINECKINNGNCQQICRNSIGSYVCVCFDGYTFNATTRRCEDINECAAAEDICKCARNMSSCNATCINKMGDYKCACSSGYKLVDKSTCIDLDECSDSSDNGGCSHVCRNLIGSYACECPFGLQLSSDLKTCNDTNECLIENGGCIHDCDNTYGSYICKCRDGYQLDRNGFSCYDTNECHEDSHGCDVCENTIGGYRCICLNGYKLNPDNKTCSDVNECMPIEETSSTYAGCSQHCNNTIGSFQCFCDPGYLLAEDNRTCADINECRDNIHRCDHICVNNIGSYTCLCSDGFRLDKDMLTCHPEPCITLPIIVNGNATCLNGFTGSSCGFYCNPGFSLSGANERFCQANHKWNGTQPFCNRKQCVELNPPINGKLIQPCNNFYEGKCTASCRNGYYLVGRQINTCGINNGTDQVMWLEDQQCKASTACKPNPCLHNGICSLQKDSFACNCKGTLYNGKRCNQGILKVPQLPIQRPNITNIITIKARPDEHLIVQIIFNKTMLSVEPSILNFTKSVTEVRVFVRGLISGFSTLRFNLFGKNADVFKNPGMSTVYVKHTKFDSLIVNTDGTFVNGCYKQIQNNIEFLSNTEWVVRKTNGITQVVTGDKKVLPLSLTGGQINFENVFDNYNFDGNTIQNKAFYNKCNKNSEQEKSIGKAVSTNAILYTIEVIFNNILPYWFQVSVVALNNVMGYNDVKGRLFLGSELLKKSDKCTNNYEFERSHIYYIIKTSQDLHVIFPTDMLKLDANIKKCFILDVTTGNTAYLTFIPDDEQLLIEFQKTLSGFLQIGSIKTSSITFIQEENSFDTIRFFGKRKFNVKNDKMNIFVTLHGHMEWNVSNYDNLPSIDQQYTLKVSTNSTIFVTIDYIIDKKSRSVEKRGKIYSYVEERLNYETFVKLIIKTNTGELFELHFEFSNFKNKRNIHSNIFEPFDSFKTVVNDNVNFVTQSFIDRDTSSGNAALSFTNSTVKLLTLIDMLDQNDKKFLSIQKMSDIRSQLLKTLKYFSLLLDSYLTDEDPWDGLQLEQKYIDFRKSINILIQKTRIHLNVLFSDTRVKAVKIGLPQFCIGTYCLENVKTFLNLPTETYSGKTISSVQISDFLSIKKDVDLSYDVNKKIVKPIPASVLIFNEHLPTMINIESNLLHFTISSNSFINSDNISINFSGSLQGLYGRDPITFRVQSNLTRALNFRSTVNGEILTTFTDLKTSLAQKRRSLQTFYEEAIKNAREKTAALLKSVSLVAFLGSELVSVAQNISRYTFEIEKIKPDLENLLKLHKNILEYNMTNFLEKCQAKFCISKCVPGYKKSLCKEEQKLELIDHICELQPSSYTEKILQAYKKQIEYTDYKKQVYCRTKCPPLTTFFKGIFGRRKKRGIGIAIAIGKRVINAAKLAKKFENLGGTEASIGSFIGGVLLGPAGAIIGGTIGSIFGSCDKSCLHTEIPYQTNRNITVLGYKTLVHDLLLPHCENKEREVKAGDIYYYGCEIKSNCANVKVDGACFKEQKECRNIRKNIENNLNDSTIKETVQAFNDYTALLDLAKRKKDVLNLRYENALKEQKISESRSLIANNSKHTYERSIKLFNETSNAKIRFLKQFQKDGKVIHWKASISFFQSAYQKLPQSYLISFKINNSTFTSFYNRSTHQKSVSDAAQELYEGKLKLSQKQRRRRSVSQDVSSQINKKCHTIQKAVVYLFNVLSIIESDIRRYEDDIMQRKRIGDSSKQIKTLLQEQVQSFSLSSQVQDTINEFSNDLAENHVGASSWKDIHKSILSRLELTTSLIEETDCFNLEDCTSYYIMQIGKLIYLTDLSDKINIPQMKSNFSLLLNSSQPFQKMKIIQKVVANNFQASTLKIFFCGNRPEILIDIGGIVHTVEGEEVFFNIVLKSSSDSSEISWKYDRKYIKGATSLTLKIRARLNDTGVYSCELRNKYGITFCGSVLLRVSKKIFITDGPISSNGFIGAPQPLILNCKTNFTREFSRKWYYRINQTEQKVILPGNEASIIVPQNNTSNSGYYSCKIQADEIYVQSEEVSVNILQVSAAVNQISLSMTAIRSKENRSRRSVEGTNIKDAISTALLVDQHQVENVNVVVTRHDNDTESLLVSFVLIGENYTKLLAVENGDDTWSSNENVTEGRQKLFSRIIYLYYQANSSLIFQVNGSKYIVDADSVGLEPLDPRCPAGQFLLDNGLICGNCPPGSQEIENVCIKCPLNTYQEFSGQQTCKKCRNGTLTIHDGSASIKKCINPTTTTPPTTTPPTTTQPTTTSATTTPPTTTQPTTTSATTTPPTTTQPTTTPPTTTPPTTTQPTTTSATTTPALTTISLSSSPASSTTTAATFLLSTAPSNTNVGGKPNVDKSNIGTIIGCAVGGIIAIIIIAVILAFLIQRCRMKNNDNQKIDSFQNPVYDCEASDIPPGKIDPSPQYECIKHIQEKVSQERIEIKDAPIQQGASYERTAEPNIYEGLGFGFCNQAYGRVPFDKTDDSIYGK